MDGRRKSAHRDFARRSVAEDAPPELSRMAREDRRARHQAGSVRRNCGDGAAAFSGDAPDRSEVWAHNRPYRWHRRVLPVAPGIARHALRRLAQTDWCRSNFFRLKRRHKIPSQPGPNAEVRLVPNSWNGTGLTAEPERSSR